MKFSFSSRPAIKGRPRRSQVSARLIALGVALALAQAAGAADKRAPTIKDLKSKPVDVRKDTQVSATSSKAMEN